MSKLIESAETVDLYVNLFLNKNKVYSLAILQTAKLKEKYYQSGANAGKVALIDYSTEHRQTHWRGASSFHGYRARRLPTFMKRLDTASSKTIIWAIGERNLASWSTPISNGAIRKR